MKRTVWITVSVLVLLLLLAGGAFLAGRLLSAGSEVGADETTLKVVTGNGQVAAAQWVPAAEYPAADPEVAGAFLRRQDNSLFVNETKDGFVITKNDQGAFSVTNTTGQIHEVVVTGETAVYVDVTHENIDDAVAEGKLYQKLRIGSIEEIGDLSYVQAWGEKRGDRLIAGVLVYTRPPVINR